MRTPLSCTSDPITCCNHKFFCGYQVKKLEWVWHENAASLLDGEWQEKLVYNFGSFPTMQYYQDFQEIVAPTDRHFYEHAMRNFRHNFRS